MKISWLDFTSIKVSNTAISEESSAAVDQIQRVLENVNLVVTILQKEMDKFTI